MEGLRLIKLTVNGQIITLSHSITIAEFLTTKNVDLLHVAIAYNGEVIPQDRYRTIMLKPNDILEIVRPVGGG